MRKKGVIKNKVNIYKSVIRLVLLHRTDTAALIREEERRLEATEMRMIRMRRQ